MARMRGDAALVLLNVENHRWDEAARLLEALGGARDFPAGGIVYTFPSGEARDAALERVRRAFGWTVAGPRDALLWAVCEGIPSARSGAPAVLAGAR